MDELEGRLWSDARGFQYFEVSALSGDGVSEMFQVIIFLKLLNHILTAVVFHHMSCQMS